MLENKISLKKNIPIEEDITFDIKRDRVAEKLFKLSSKENIKRTGIFVARQSIMNASSSRQFQTPAFFPQ